MINKLNPANSLFGRIFIWFWLSVTALLIAAFLSARLSQTHTGVTQPNERQENMGARAAGVIQEIIEERGVSIERAIRRSANRGRWRIVTVNLNKQELKTDFPNSLLSSSSEKTIFDLASANSVVLVTTSQLEFIGPYEVIAEGEVYQVFIGRLLRREERAPFSWGIALMAIVCVGSLLCLVLAYRLSKPLAQLRSASRAFANGDLQSRVKGQEHRKDEIGLLAADFNSMADKLNASMQQQQLLLANISHELRTPLTRLQLAAAILQDKADADASGNQEYLKRIELEISNMDKLIGQILSLTRLQNVNNGLIVSQHDEFKERSLKALFEPLINNLTFEAKAVGKHIECNDIPLGSILVNDDAILSGIENIVRNAIKFSKKSVWLMFEITSNHDLLLHVDDDGLGLEASELDKLFEPFYQSSNAVSDNVLKGDKNNAGVGLGLAIANAAVQLHKGTLTVVSSLHGGLCFKISLPLSNLPSTK